MKATESAKSSINRHSSVQKHDETIIYMGILLNLTKDISQSDATDAAIKEICERHLFEIEDYEKHLMIRAIKTVIKKSNVRDAQDTTLIKRSFRTSTKTVSIISSYEDARRKPLEAPQLKPTKDTCPANTDLISRNSVEPKKKKLQYTDSLDFSIHDYITARAEYLGHANLSPSQESIISVCEVCQDVHPKASLPRIPPPLHRPKKSRISLLNNPGFREKFTRMSFRKIDKNGRNSSSVSPFISMLQDRYTESYMDLLRLLKVTYSFTDVTAGTSAATNGNLTENTKNTVTTLESEKDEDFDDGEQTVCCGMCRWKDKNRKL